MQKLSDVEDVGTLDTDQYLLPEEELRLLLAAIVGSPVFVLALAYVWGEGHWYLSGLLVLSLLATAYWVLSAIWGAIAGDGVTSGEVADGSR